MFDYVHFCPPREYIMIEGFTSLIAKRMCPPVLLDAVLRKDEATAQEIVNQILSSPEYLFDEYVKGNLLDQVVAMAPQCTAETIRRGLREAIAGDPVKTHMLRAILPYAELSDRQHALQFACERDCEVAIDILYPLCDIPRVMNELIKVPYLGKQCLFWATALQQRMDAEKLRKTLITQLPSVNHTSQRKI